MYKNADGTYSYVEPVEGAPAGVNTGDFRPIPHGAHIAGDYHTHAAYDPDLNGPDNPEPFDQGYNWSDDANEIFSDDDKRGNEAEHGPGFLGTPQGSTQEYIPWPGHPLGGKVIRLTERNCGCQ